MAPGATTATTGPTNGHAGCSFSSSSCSSSSSTAVASRVFHRHLGADTPPEIVCSKGNYLYCADGSRVLDACGGAAVVSIGHGDERVIKAITEQLRTVNFVHSGIWTNSAAEELADILCKSSGMARCLFTSGGSEALESAIKLARQYHVERGDTERVHFIARKQSYHGNTLGALGLGSFQSRKEIYSPLLPIDVFHHVSPCYPYRYKLDDSESDAAYVERLAQELEDKIIELGTSKVAAFFFEPVVGAATGCVPFLPGYIRKMKAVCHKYGILMVCDEIMCGMGRTGKMHAWQWDGEDEARPDIQAVGKGLSGGYAPCAAILASESVIASLISGSGIFRNGYTYQAWSIGARAGLAVQKIIEEDGLVQACHQRGLYLKAALTRELETCSHVGNIRGMGLFWGIEFVTNRTTKETFPQDFPIGIVVAEKMLRQGVAVYPGSKGTVDGIRGDHLLIAPPYTVTEMELDRVASVLRTEVDSLVAEYYRHRGR